MKNVLISGASIAGPALAYWLHRYGFNVTLVERSPAPREGGYAIDVRGKAIDVLAQMNILAEVRRENCDTIGTTFLDPRGERAATMAGGFGVINANDVEIMRGDLVRILYEATKQDVTYLFGDSIRALEQHADGVHVTFEHNEPCKFDVVIGADGLHSNVRRLVFGDEAQFMHHLGSYMAIFTAPNHLALDRWQLVFNTPGRVVSIKTTRGNHEFKATVFFSSPKLSFDYRDIAAQKQMTADAFADAGWELPQLISAMQDAPDFYFDSTSQVRMPRWSLDRVAFVGDACACPSPLAGAGSSMAIIGAYVLAGELAAAGGDHCVALPKYEDAVRAYAWRNQQLSNDIADGFAPKSKFGIWSRNVGLSMLRWLPGSGAIMKLAMRGVATASMAIALRDYRGFEVHERRQREAVTCDPSQRTAAERPTHTVSFAMHVEPRN